VTDLLLGELCVAKKHSRGFCSTTTIRVSLSSAADENTIAALSMLVINVRKQQRLEVPHQKQLARQFQLYYDLVSPDCPIDLATTDQYGEEEWSIRTGTILPENTRIPYLKALNA
jgi:hypothetical protein